MTALTSRNCPARCICTFSLFAGFDSSSRGSRYEILCQMSMSLSLARDSSTPPPLLAAIARPHSTAGYSRVPRSLSASALSQTPNGGCPLKVGGGGRFRDFRETCSEDDRGIYEEWLLFDGGMLGIILVIEALCQSNRIVMSPSLFALHHILKLLSRTIIST